MYWHANPSGRQLVMGRCYQETDRRTKDQIYIPDWCGVKSFTPSDERYKDLVQQEQISDLLHPRVGTGDQNFNSSIESNHSPCNYLCMKATKGNQDIAT